jgi:ATP-dependent Clp protease ATP-binding subunit ClpC
VFERFTEGARAAVASAQSEARRLGHRQVGSEHLLLGLLSLDGSVASQALTSVGVARDPARAAVAHDGGSGVLDPSQIAFTSDAKRVLERSLREAVRLGHNYVGSEHLLLGVLREEDAAGFRVLQEMEVDTEALRELTLELIASRPDRRGLPHAPDVSAALSRAADVARDEGADQVELRHLRQVMEGT